MKGREEGEESTRGGGSRFLTVWDAGMMWGMQVAGAREEADGRRAAGRSGRRGGGEEGEDGWGDARTDSQATIAVTKTTCRGCWAVAVITATMANRSFSDFIFDMIERCTCQGFIG